MSEPALPGRPPFVLRARLLTPLGAGGSAWEPDAALEVDPKGRIVHVGPWSTWKGKRGHALSAYERSDAPPIVDLRPWVLLPGLVDLHIHLPQFPSAGLGAGLDLLTWLARRIFLLERG